MALRFQCALVFRSALLLRGACFRQSPRRFTALYDAPREMVRSYWWDLRYSSFTSRRRADADKYTKRFAARVWIHHYDRSAASYATDVLYAESDRTIAPGVVAIPVPGHTRGSVAYLLDDRVLFTGDSLAWNMHA